MHCVDVRDLLQPFHDSELEVEKNVAVLKHLELCGPCRERSETDQRLRHLVQRAALPSLGPDATRRLMAAALDGDSGRWRSAPPRSPWLRRGLALAAAVLLAAGIGISQADPFCWGGCPSQDQLLLTTHVVPGQQPQPLADVEARLHRRIEAPELVGLEFMGATTLEPLGYPGRPALHFRLAQGKLCYFSLPASHAHVGRRQRLVDGREYVLIQQEGARLVGWIEGDLIQCVVPCSVLPDDELYMAAAALRLGRTG